MNRYHKEKQPAGQTVPLPGARLTAFLSFFIMILVLSAGNAWSFERLDLTQSAGHSSAFTTGDGFSSVLSSSMADSCSLLLKSSVHSETHTVMDRSRHSAGLKAAPLALGLVVGIRYALSPPNKAAPTGKKGAAPRLDVWQTLSPQGDPHALAIADYRSCQKDKALKALEHFRWKR